MRHSPAEHCGVAFARLHAFAQLPQWVGSALMFISQPSAAMPLQLAYPALHANPHVVPSQVEDAFGYVGHAPHEPPQVATALLLTQAPPQLWKPALQLMPQFVPSHVAVPLTGTEHARHELPQLPMLELLTHAPAHRW